MTTPMYPEPDADAAVGVMLTSAQRALANRAGGDEASRLVYIHTRLSLPSVKRTMGLLDGLHPSLLKGSGQDFDDLSYYQPGDDATDIDWRSSARLGVPVVKRYIHESNENIILAVDTGAAMAGYSPERRPKGELVTYACGVIAYLAHRRGDHVGLAAGNAGAMRHLPARGSRGHLELLLRVVDRSMTPGAAATSLPGLVNCVLGALGRRGLVVLITDEAHPGPDDVAALRRLLIKHQVLCVQIADLSPTGLLPEDEDDIQDVQADWDLPPEIRTDPALRAEAERAAAARTAQTAQILTDLSIPFVRTTSQDDFLDDFTSLLERLDHG